MRFLQNGSNCPVCDNTIADRTNGARIILDHPGQFSWLSFSARSCFPSLTLFVYLDSVFAPLNNITSLLEVSCRSLWLRDQIMSVFFSWFCRPAFPSGLPHYEYCLVWSFPLFFLASSFPSLECPYRLSFLYTYTRIHVSVLEWQMPCKPTVLFFLLICYSSSASCSICQTTLLPLQL